MEKIRYYKSFTDDFYEDNNKTHTLPENYEWIQKGVFKRILSGVIYGLVLLFSLIYCRLFLHVKIKGKEKLKKAEKSGIFLYGNHTQPVGDVFNPALVCFPKRIYTIADAANMSLPVIGKILPYLGALPIPKSLRKMREFTDAIETRLSSGCAIVIYPEAHVWDYCSFIRPFPNTSFKYPVNYGKPVYCITTTYKKRRFFKKPAATIYIDGPFDVPQEGTAREKASVLRDKVYDCMVRRSKSSNIEYIVYKKEE